MGAGDSFMSGSAEMAALREKIDALDTALVDLFAERQRCIESAAEIKSRIDWPARVPARVDEVLDHVAACAKEKNFDEKIARSIWSALIEWSIAYEERLMRSKSAVSEKDRA